MDTVCDVLILILQATPQGASSVLAVNCGLPGELTDALPVHNAKPSHDRKSCDVRLSLSDDFYIWRHPTSPHKTNFFFLLAMGKISKYFSVLCGLNSKCYYLNHVVSFYIIHICRSGLVLPSVTKTVIGWEQVNLYKSTNISTEFDFQVTVHLGTFLIIKPNRCPNFSNLFWNETIHVSDSSSVRHQEFFTVHTAMIYVIQVCWQLAVSKRVW
jgi:hypothetical protein